jgi:hypothetical protein
MTKEDLMRFYFKAFKISLCLLILSIAGPGFYDLLRPKTLGTHN